MPLSDAHELAFSSTLMLADSVVVAEGKLYVQGGGWDVLSPPGYPFRIPRLGIALSISVPYGETNKNHKVVVQLQGEDGQPIQLGMAPPDPSDPAGLPKPITQMEGVLNMGRPPFLRSGDSQAAPMAMNVDGVVIQSPGAYAVVLEVDDEEIGRARFRALEIFGLQKR